MTDATNAPTNNYRRIERVVKGFANHRRLEILYLLHKEPELSLEDISERLNIGYENAYEHVRKLIISGLILKRNDARNVRHKLTSRAELILTFCKTLE